MNFYDKFKKTIANSVDIADCDEQESAFPKEGVCMGTFSANNIQFPALLDFLQKGTCFVYDSEQTQRKINDCLEKIAWRLALSVPVQLAEFVVYNGGIPGDNFISLDKFDRTLFRSAQKVLYDGNYPEFRNILTEIYNEIPARRRAIYDSEKSNLYELNESEGDAANIKYIFLFVSDFTRIDNEQKKLLLKIIAADCAKSGIFVFISWDLNYKEEYDKINYQDIFSNMTLLLPKDGRYFFKNSEDDALRNKFILSIDGKQISKKEEDKLSGILNARIEKSRKTVATVNIREQVLTPELMWSKKCKNGIEIPVGNISSKELMKFELCPKRDSTIVHSIVCGGTGSGKSTLLHDIIINGAWMYPPDELQFVLLDFKSVEFGIYSKLPHVRILSTQSDREYGMEVLKYICDEIEKRKKLFGNVSSIEEYNDDKHHVPRILVVIDEFQNLFVEGDSSNMPMRELTIKSQIDKHFSKILKEGRSFGIHLLLATQQTDSIGRIDAYLQQIKLRIVLQMQKKNQLLADENKAQPEKLKRGYVIYNENLGNEGCNQMFRYAFYGSETITHKQVIEEELMVPIISKECTNMISEKYIYHGKGCSVISDNKCVVHSRNDEKCVVYVGSPVTVRNDDISFELLRRRSSNVMIVGAGSDYLYSMVRLVFQQAIEQSSQDSRFAICFNSNESCNADSWNMDRLKILKDKDNKGLESAVQELARHLDDRQKGKEATADRIVFTLLGLQYFDVIKPETELKKQLQYIVKNGPEYGIHIIIHSERYSDVKNAFKRDDWNSNDKLELTDFIREFGVKIQIKGSDSEELLSKDKDKSPQEVFLANIQTKENGDITKFSIYKQ